jgi:hypothetical protein
MKIKKKYGVIWKDIYVVGKSPDVKVTIYMPREIADMDRTVIEGIKNTIGEYNKHGQYS